MPLLTNGHQHDQFNVDQPPPSKTATPRILRPADEIDAKWSHKSPRYEHYALTVTRYPTLHGMQPEANRTADGNSGTRRVLRNGEAPLPRGHRRTSRHGLRSAIGQGSTVGHFSFAK